LRTRSSSIMTGERHPAPGWYTVWQDSLTGANSWQLCGSCQQAKRNNVPWPPHCHCRQRRPSLPRTNGASCLSWRIILAPNSPSRVQMRPSTILGRWRKRRRDRAHPSGQKRSRQSVWHDLRRRTRCRCLYQTSAQQAPLSRGVGTLNSIRFRQPPLSARSSDFFPTWLFITSDVEKIHF